jgi:hypothetical protein
MPEKLRKLKLVLKPVMLREPYVFVRIKCPMCRTVSERTALVPEDDDAEIKTWADRISRYDGWGEVDGMWVCAACVEVPI